MAIKLEINGLEATIKRVGKMADGMKRDVQDLLNEFVSLVARTASILAPADEGNLRNAIKPVYGNDTLEASVVVTVVYAAFMEFGTRKFAAIYVATLPPDWASYAATFRTRGDGNFDEFLKAIMAWVKRKGISDKAAYPIALKILRDGVRPHPFLYPAVQEHSPELKKQFKLLLEAA